MTNDAPVISPHETYGTVTRTITGIVLPKQRGWGWWIGFTMAGGLLSILGASLFWLFYKGVGIWGINMPVAWGTAIINYVWWIEIAQGGTFISAVLLLFHQKWRNSVNRFTEAMTLFALACAGLFPLLHLGRPQYAFFLAPYPNTLGMWPQFVSPLVWDFFAVSIYGTISVLFWFLGMIPDLATLRDSTDNKWLRRLYGVACFGWRNSATPLAPLRDDDQGHRRALRAAGDFGPQHRRPGFRVHGRARVALDDLPAVLRGGRDLLGLRHGADVDPADPLDLRAGTPHHREPHQQHRQAAADDGDVRALRPLQRILHGLVQRRPVRPVPDDRPGARHYSTAFYLSMACTALAIQPLWFGFVRRSPFLLFLIAGLVNVGMWAERFLNIVGSLHRDYLTSSWGTYHTTVWDWATYIGTFGLFLTLLFLFLRLLPIVSMSEVRSLIHEEGKR